MSAAPTTVEPQNPALSFIERTQCALCDSRERTIYRAFRDIPVVRCSRCGFLYSSRIMSEETMHAYYRDNFGSLRHMQGQIVNARTNGVALEKLLNLKNVRIWLDVGTGYGFLLKWLKDKWSIRAEGVEISSQEADYARKDLGFKIYSSLEDDLPREGFDVVSSFEVIEHVAEPKPFLCKLAEYVRPGGYLVVMTDNFESIAAQKLQGGFQKWIPHTHVSHFAPATLRDCVSNVAQLKIENEASYTPWDVVGRQYVSMFRPPVPDEQAYDVHDALSTEMQRDYKLYRLRYLLNPLWARIDFNRTMEGGALMYAVCRKQG
jgi:2-polyprenyl-3-methyl-5-hydroxy-6-metoxy-1,4-benzoquinol methylase